MLNALARTRRILVVAGPGGVGKTTSAAALGVLAARAGRKTLVCTIDPAPRLADALGVPALSADPKPLAAAAAEALGILGPGQLFAARLDTARAFHNLVEEQVGDMEMRRRIFTNPIYRQITNTLTGSQEYAATLALYDLHSRNEYDLIVLDTPPTANALDFLDAPGRIGAAVASPALRWLARPQETGGLLSWRAVRAGGALALRRLGKFVGSQFLDDLGAFLTDFQLVLEAFLERAQAIDALLRRPEVAFLLVLAPEVPAVNEALYFRDRLKAAGITLQGFIANRVVSAPGLCDAVSLRERLGALGTLSAVPGATLDLAAAQLAFAVQNLAATAVSHSRQIDRLEHAGHAISVTRVPLLGTEASTLTSLRQVADCLAIPTARLSLPAA